jgi:hypothetical protein
VTDPVDQEEEIAHVRRHFVVADKEIGPFSALGIKKDKSKTQETVSDPAAKGFTTTLPYIEGTSEKLRRAFNTAGVPTAFEPHRTLRQTLVSPKEKVDKVKQSGTVYEISCKDCDAVYIGETSIGSSKRDFLNTSRKLLARNRRFKNM